MDSNIHPPPRGGAIGAGVWDSAPPPPIGANPALIGADVGVTDVENVLRMEEDRYPDETPYTPPDAPGKPLLAEHRREEPQQQQPQQQPQQPPQQPPPLAEHLSPVEDGEVLIGIHPKDNAIAKYDTVASVRELRDAARDSHAHSLSAYELAGIAFLMRIAVFTCAAIESATALAEIGFLFWFVEPLVALAVWAKSRRGLYGAFFILSVSLIAKGGYLTLIILRYWARFDDWARWTTTTLLFCYLAVSVYLSASVITVLRAVKFNLKIKRDVMNLVQIYTTAWGADEEEQAEGSCAPDDSARKVK